MKKQLTFLLLALGAATASNAQITFEQILPPPPAPQESVFEGVKLSSTAFADVDGDGDQDVLITGANPSNDRIAKLYTNDGTGQYTEVISTPFDGVHYGSVAFADVDGDNDQDVLITGENASDVRTAKLYTNDGTGQFTEVSGTPFEGVVYSSIAFADVDGDNDLDVLITGQDFDYYEISRLYTNDGTGVFTEALGTPFIEVSSGSIAFADVDGDNDPDVIITGVGLDLFQKAELYTNDGTGQFTEVAGTPFEGVTYSSIAVADVDGDNDMDVLITGYTVAFESSSKLYTNDGTGQYTEVTGTPFDDVYHSSVAFADADGDNDQDVLLTGYNNGSFQTISKLYINDGTGVYTEETGTPFDGVWSSSIAFADVDGDSDQDVLIIGQNTSNELVSKLYRNLSSSQTVFGTDVQTACGSFDWIDGFTYTQSNNQAQFTLVGAATTGADSIVTLNLTINPLPNVGVTTTDPTLTADAAGASYQWLDCNDNDAIIIGAIDQSYTATANGSYAVEVTENGCADTSACVDILTTSINELETAFSVYPNPTEGQFSIAFESVVSRVEVSITDVAGKFVNTQTFNNASTINLQINQPAGVYYVALTTAEGQQVIKMMMR